MNRASHIVTVVGVLVCCSVVAAEEGDEAQREKRSEAALKTTTTAAQNYRFQFPTDGPDVQLVEKPILRWSNPTLGEVYGNIFLWTRQGRPVVAASFHKWFHPRTDSTHEFQSLCETTLKATGDRGSWEPERAGIAFEWLTDERPPARTSSLRGLQLKALARKFVANKQARDGEKSKLRLLARPVYRYQTPDESDIADGALFAFVEGNDPEIWLLLEAAKINGRLSWRYSLARMNSTILSVDFAGKQVWQAAELPWSTALDSTQPFALLNRPN